MKIKINLLSIAVDLAKDAVEELKSAKEEENVKVYYIKPKTNQDNKCLISRGMHLNVLGNN